MLLPKTIDFYQIEITRMLETERYEEAIALLRFLEKCESGDPNTNKEWLALLGWLESINDIQAESVSLDSEESEESEESEMEILRQHLQQKTEQDPNYITLLLEMLQPNVAAHKQLIALDQLAYINGDAKANSKIAEVLIEWLEANTISPWVQFKALQVLRIRKHQGELLINKDGGQIKIELDQVPIDFEEYPAIIGLVLDRLQQVAEMDEPSLAYFASEIWEQFLAYIYATPAYELLVHGEEASIHVWASALHSLIGELMTGSVNEAEVKKLYNLPDDSRLLWKQALQTLKSFAAQFPITLK